MRSRTKLARRNAAEAALGLALERAVQAGLTWTGRGVDLHDAPWLAGPIGPTVGRVGAETFQEYAEGRGLVVETKEPGAGLMTDLATLGGGGFDPDGVSSGIRAFYERTASFDLDAVVRWYAPVGLVPRAAVHFTGPRSEQYHLPTAARSSELVLTNEVMRMLDPETGEAACAGWLRRSVATGKTVLAGLYSACELPGHAGRYLKGVYPLPGGSATVILRPENRPDGSLVLVSDGLGFGEAGYYRLHDSRRGLRAFCAPIRQDITMWETSLGSLRVSHVFRCFGLRFLELRYYIQRAGEGPNRN